MLSPWEIVSAVAKCFWVLLEAPWDFLVGSSWLVGTKRNWKHVIILFRRTIQDRACFCPDHVQYDCEEININKTNVLNMQCKNAFVYKIMGQHTRSLATYMPIGGIPRRTHCSCTHIGSFCWHLLHACLRVCWISREAPRADGTCTLTQSQCWHLLHVCLQVCWIPREAINRINETRPHSVVHVIVLCTGDARIRYLT